MFHDSDRQFLPAVLAWRKSPSQWSRRAGLRNHRSVAIKSASLLRTRGVFNYKDTMSMPAALAGVINAKYPATIIPRATTESLARGADIYVAAAITGVTAGDKTLIEQYYSGNFTGSYCNDKLRVTGPTAIESSALFCRYTVTNDPLAIPCIQKRNPHLTIFVRYLLSVLFVCCIEKSGKKDRSHWTACACHTHVNRLDEFRKRATSFVTLAFGCSCCHLIGLERRLRIGGSGEWG